MKSVAGFALLALTLTSCSLIKGHSAVQVGQALPQMSFADLDGTTKPLTLTTGRVTFVNVFATWCPPCKAETPDLTAFAARMSAKGVDVIGIDQEETQAQVRAFAEHYGIRYPIVIDTGRETKDVLGARIIPRTIVVDGKGIVRAVISGPMTADQMTKLAAEAAADL
jgi:thiol-disulfide isomerase/thioredoxin